MSVETFGVLPATIRNEYFTGLQAFSATTSPSSTTVTEVIRKQAATLAGKLALEGITAATIATDTASPAYAMVGDQIARMAAVAIGQNMTGMNAELLKAWQASIAEWFKGLADGGGTFLGNASLQTSATPPDGPTTHINFYGLAVSSGIEPSSIDPFFQRDDKL